MKDLSTVIECPLYHEELSSSEKESSAEESTNKRKIRFAECVVDATYYTLNIDDFSREEQEAYWWGEDSKTQLRRVAKKAAKIFGSSHKAERFVNGLDDTYDDLRGMAKLVRLSGGDGYDSYIYTDPGSLSTNLESWVLSCGEHRGLERSASPYQLRQRVARTKHYQHEVLQMSWYGIRGEELCERSRAVSSSARIWSRLMGHADAVAAQAVHQQEFKIHGPNSEPSLSPKVRRGRKDAMKYDSWANLGDVLGM